MKDEFWPLNFSKNDTYYARLHKYISIAFKVYVVALISGSLGFVQYPFDIGDENRDMPLVMW